MGPSNFVLAKVRYVVTLILVAGLFPGRIDAQTGARVNVPANVDFQPNIVYSEPNGNRLLLDLAVPRQGNGPHPTVLLFNGTGPLSKERAGLREYAFALAQQGYLAVMVQYRHESKHAFPAAYDDGFAALDWVIKNCDKHQIDKNRVGALGFSGGGSVAMMLGTKEPAKVRAVVSLFGPSDMAMFHEKANDFTGTVFLRPMLEQWLGGTPKQVPKVYRDASPVTFAKKGSAPHLFIQGTADDIVPLDQSRIMADKLRAVGVKASLITLDGAPHCFDELPGLYAQVALSATGHFFAQHLMQRTVEGSAAEDLKAATKQAAK